MTGAIRTKSVFFRIRPHPPLPEVLLGSAAMSSFIIQSHVGRQVPLAWVHNDSCAFCRIINGELSSHTVYETEKVIAILGIHILILFTVKRSFYEVA